MLVNTIIDRIYLYDDHFSIYVNHAGRKGKVSDREAADIEHYFDNNPNESSITLESGTPPNKNPEALGITAFQSFSFLFDHQFDHQFFWPFFDPFKTNFESCKTYKQRFSEVDHLNMHHSDAATTSECIVPPFSLFLTN